MSKIEALQNYANAYRDCLLFRKVTFNIDVTTQFAIDGLISQARGDEDYLIFLANDEAEILRESVAKEKALLSDNNGKD
jgi:hypothetical protein